ncbi:TonB-dependent receptor plug domain-containing protein [Sphingomonas sp. C8-2]|jgi:iron complex outermembrane receptor protein|nr:TonB-dependent receptor plug domain-containing protein [Sphingomonas sp. C8-2]
MHMALLSTTAMLLLAAPAAAQTEAPADEGLQDIIVTAQRQKETLQRAAIAVDVVQGSDLVDAGVTQMDRLGELAPSLTIQPTSTGNILFVRGVGNFTVSPNSDPAIAFNYDGIYVGRPTSTTGTFFDLERIEVLKGPQGTLYGRNATGGAINVIPAQPKIGEWSGYGTVSFANYKTVTGEGAINIPMGENGAMRIAGSIAHHDGYLRDDTADDKTHSLRVQLKAELTPTLTVRLAGDYSHTGGKGAGPTYQGHYAFNPASRQYQFIASGLPVSEGMFTPAAQAYRATIRAGTAGRNLDALGPTPFQDNSFYGANAEIAWDTGIGTLTVIPAWRYAKLNLLSSAAGFMYRQNETDEQYSLEARFQGNRIGMFDYTLGGYYYHERINAVTALSLSSAVSYLRPNYRTESWAPFGRLTAHLSDALRLVGGVRYTDDKKRFTGPTIAGAIVCTTVVAGVPTCPNAPLFPLATGPSALPFAFAPQGVPVLPIIVGGVPTGAIVARTDRLDNSRLANNKVTWRAAVEFDVAPQSLLYASFETGYRSGGFSPAQGFETFDPEYLDAYTIGSKNRFFGNRVQLNLEAFYWKYRDQQVNHVGLDLSGRTANFTQNIGRSTIKGAEVEARMLVTPTTLLSGNVQYLDATNKAFLYQQAVGTPGTPPPLTGCAVRLNANPTLYDVDCAGFQSYNSPKWTINLAAQQTFELGDYVIVAGADSQYKSSRNIGFSYLPEQRVDGDWLVNAQLSFGPADDRWSLAGFVRNIGNNRIPLGSSLHPTANILALTTSAPRTYGVRASAKF